MITTFLKQYWILFLLLVSSMMISCASQTYWNVPKNTPKSRLAKIMFDKRNEDDLKLLSIDQETFTKKQNSPFLISAGEHELEFTFYMVHTERQLNNPFTMDPFRESVTDVKTTTVVNKSAKPVLIDLDAKSGHTYRVYLHKKLKKLKIEEDATIKSIVKIFGPSAFSASVIIYDETEGKQVASSEIEVETEPR